MVDFNGLIRKKQWAYRSIFFGENGELSEAGKIVLTDLIEFVGLNKTIATTELAAFGAEKARQPIKRLLNFLKIDHIDTYDFEEDYNEL